MDFKIKKHKNNQGYFFHKSVGIKCTHTKKQALIDISFECANGDFYTKNYLAIENIVLKACSCRMIIFQL